MNSLETVVELVDSAPRFVKVQPIFIRHICSYKNTTHRPDVNLSIVILLEENQLRSTIPTSYNMLR